MMNRVLELNERVGLGSEKHTVQKRFAVAIAEI